MVKRISLSILKKGDLEWVRNLRNKNRKFFLDNRFISKKQHEKWFKMLNYPFFIIKYNGAKSGTIAVRESLGLTEVHNVLIDSKFREKGILKRVITILEKKQKKSLYVDVRVDNKDAFNVYKKLGFKLFSYRMKKK
jgi:ribosomal protein S18 acetylase RimI-like enzyme